MHHISILLERLRKGSGYEGRPIEAYEVDSVLQLLKYSKVVDPKAVVQKLQLPLEAVLVILKEAGRMKLQSHDASSSGGELGASDISTINSAYCVHTDAHNASRGRPVTRPLKTVRREMVGIIASRPPVNRGFDQWHATLDTTIRRLKLMRDRCDLYDKSVLIIGDDDYLGIAIALASPTTKVTVLEVDTVLCDAIQQAVILQDLSLSVVQYDVRDPFPEHLKGHFDVACTDPPYTKPGVTVFLSRASQGLKNQPGGVCYISVSTQELTMNSLMHIERVMDSMGFVISEALQNFNEYDMTESQGQSVADSGSYFTSTLFRLLSPGGRKEVEIGEVVKANLYNYEKA